MAIALNSWAGSPSMSTNMIVIAFCKKFNFIQSEHIKKDFWTYVIINTKRTNDVFTISNKEISKQAA